MVPNSIPIQNTEMASQMMNIIPMKDPNIKLELKECLPCIFHYCVQDIETFLHSKINNKRMKEILTNNEGNTELREVYTYSNDKVEFNIPKIGNNPTENNKTGNKKAGNKKGNKQAGNKQAGNKKAGNKIVENNKTEKDFLIHLQDNENDYKSILDYYQNSNMNKIRNRLLFNRF